MQHYQVVLQGTYLGTGTVLTQQNNVVQVRNPPRPPQRENEVEVRTSTMKLQRSEQIVRELLEEDVEIGEEEGEEEGETL